MVSQALASLTVTLRDVAQWLDVSYGAVRAYRLKARTPSPEIRQRLIRALRSQAERLQELANRLDRESKP